MTRLTRFKRALEAGLAIAPRDPGAARVIHSLATDYFDKFIAPESQDSTLDRQLREAAARAKDRSAVAS